MNAVKMLEEYKPADISPADYSFVKENVPTIAVQAVLVSYDFSQRSGSISASYTKNCEQLGKFADLIRTGLPALKETGHAKWKEVNLEANVNTWKRDACAWEILNNAKSAESSKDLLNILDKK
jgi:hypothetical protein